MNDDIRWWEVGGLLQRLRGYFIGFAVQTAAEERETGNG